MAEHRFDLAASSLRADAADSRALAEALAAKLSEALPGQTRTRRQAARFLSRDKRLERVEVQLGDETFVLSLSGNAQGQRTGGQAAVRNMEDMKFSAIPSHS